MNKIFCILCVAILACGCQQTTDNYYPSEKECLCNDITKKVAIELKNELDLLPFGSGGQAMNQIKMLAISFLYRHPLEIAEGRELLIAAVEKFAAKINANEAIRPYLNNYPFGPKNIEIRIFIQAPNGKDFGSEKLCLIKAQEGFLEYEIHSGEYNLKTVYKETFEEALQKLNRAKQSA